MKLVRVRIPSCALSEAERARLLSCAVNAVSSGEWFESTGFHDAHVAQLAEASRLERESWGFNSLREYHADVSQLAEDLVSKTRRCGFDSRHRYCDHVVST